MWRPQPLSATACEEIEVVLNDGESALFGRFSLSDQQHSYQVFHKLRSAGHNHPALLAAALLHDVGKTRAPLSAWERSLVVLVGVFWPGKMAAWGQGEPQGRRRPFVVKWQHPAWGAAMTEAAGSHPLTVTLIRRHQDSLPATAVAEEDKLLRLLQWADDQS